MSSSRSGVISIRQVAVGSAAPPRGRSRDARMYAIGAPERLLGGTRQSEYVLRHGIGSVSACSYDRVTGPPPDELPAHTGPDAGGLRLAPPLPSGLRTGQHPRPTQPLPPLELAEERHGSYGAHVTRPPREEPRTANEHAARQRRSYVIGDSR